MNEDSNASQAPGQAPQTTSTPVAPSVPATWPGAFGAYKHSKAVVKRNLGTILGLTILSIVLSITASSRRTSGLMTLIVLLMNVAALFVGVAAIKAYLVSMRNTTITFGDALKAAEPMLVVKYFAASIVSGLLLFVSFLLFIVPFFFVAPRLLLFPYYLIDKNLGPIEAIKASWEATKGHAGKVWGIIGASLAMALLMLTVIGIPFAIYFLFMYSAVSVVLYEFINQHKPAAPAEPAYPSVPSNPAPAA